ncbi:MAG: ubiquinone/menaquinone biosynthesis C-methylase UbiE [Arenicella sp.]|jgi:ubiquinone/menaquinone biosynthesis C-methylase UbiE
MKDQKLTTQVFSEGAKGYAEKFMTYDAYHDSFDVFCGLIKKDDAEILDAACGPGNITNYLLKKNPSFKITGTDLAPKMIELAKELNQTAKFELRDLLSLDKTYDAIICGFGLPYLNKEEALRFIEKVSHFLCAEGVLYLSTMEDEYSNSGFQKSSSGKGPSLFIHYHEAEYLKTEMIKSGFEVVFEDRKEYVHTAEKSFTDLILIGKKTK